MWNIHPENVYWESIRSEVSVPACNRCGTYRIPLAEVEAQAVYRRQWSKASNLGQLRQYDLWRCSGLQILGGAAEYEDIDNSRFSHKVGV